MNFREDSLSTDCIQLEFVVHCFKRTRSHGPKANRAKRTSVRMQEIETRAPPFTFNSPVKMEP